MAHFDASAIARHVAMLHRLATGKDGKLILAAFGEGLAEVKHFDVGDIVGMTRAALDYQHVPEANIYAPIAVMRADLPEGKKGAEEDVIAVLGAVVDSDADKGKSAPYPPVQANYSVETSLGNFQHFLIFDKALSAADAKPLFEALKRATRADGASNICHVWRIPGCANWPNAAKLKRGRSPEPFLVRATRPWNSGYTSVEKLRAALELYWHEPAIERPATATATAGELDLNDVAGVVAFLNERDEFLDYEPWLRAGMVLKLTLGDAGFKVWETTFNDTVTSDVANSKWASFAGEPKPGCATILSLIGRARELGWHGSVRKTTAAMFDGVAAIAQAAGASLPMAVPGPTGAMPMLQGQTVLAALAKPILEAFLRNTSNHRAPRTADYPTLPKSTSGHGLYSALCAAVPRIIAMTENGPKLFRHDREAVVEPLAILQIVHVDTFDAVRRRIASFGCELPERKIKHAAAALQERVDRAFVSGDWQLDKNGNIETDNPDNVAVFLGVIGCDIWWNNWIERMEIKGGNDPEVAWSDWTSIDDTIVAKLRTRAMRTKTRFRPPKEFLWEALLALAHKNLVDPVLELLTDLQNKWDGKPRLDMALITTCHLPDDDYHKAVGRNSIGGMVRRARHPGVKHDTMPVLFGPQGTGKSTLVAIIADMGQSSLDALIKGEGRYFTDAIKLGDEAKELVLSLAGRLVAEIGEMGMRGNTNPAHVKAMVSRQIDSGRTAYARSVSDRPRRNVFWGTTNDDEPLTDPTGNRRFLPVHITREIDLSWMVDNIKQVIGEAAARESKGEDFAIPRHVWGIAAEHAEAARSESDMEIRFTEWFAETPHTAFAFVTGADLSELCDLTGLRGNNATRSAVMKRLGFRKERPSIGGRQSVVWVRGPDVLPKVIEREAVRYTTGRDGNGRPRVGIQMLHATAPLVPSQEPMPPLRALAPPKPVDR